MGASDYRPLRADEMQAHIALLLFTFGSQDAYQAAWRRAIGDDHHRGLFEDGTLLAALSWIVSAHHVFARPVPTGCISGVAVAPEARSRGVGRRLIAGAIEEAARNGWGFVTLFASTPAFYRRNGFANAGQYTVYSARTRPLDVVGFPEGWRIEAHPVADDPAPLQARCEAIRARWLALGQGLLGRAPFLRWRQWNRNEGHRRLFFLTGPDGEEAYALLTRQRDTLVLADWCAPGARGPRAILHLIAGQRTMANTVTWCGAPLDPLVEAMPDSQWTVREQEPFMSRIADLGVALTARGYPPHASGRLDFRYADPLLADRSGAYRLTVAGGRGALQRLDALPEEHLDLPVETAAPLVLGHASASRLAAMGRISGSPGMITMADSLFAAPAPWVEEFF